MPTATQQSQAMGRCACASPIALSRFSLIVRPDTARSIELLQPLGLFDHAEISQASTKTAIAHGSGIHLASMRPPVPPQWDGCVLENPMKLYIGNKNYSSWSMRPWLVLTQFGIAFQEVTIPFDAAGAFDPGSAFKQAATALSPVGKVPVLVDSGAVIWDSLAIVEYLAEQHAGLWPVDRVARARARSVCAEMHSGFASLRRHCGMNLEASLPEIGRIVMRDHAGVRADLARIVAMWSELLAQHGGPMLFGSYSIADAYFAPVCARIRGYNLPVPEPIAQYVARVFDTSAMQAWHKDALSEASFVADDEPYRTAR